jgi:hypothetical protein
VKLSIHPSVPSSILTVAERIIALGPHDEIVHLPDFQGNQLLSPHPPPRPPPLPSLSLSYNLMWHHIIIFYNVKAEKLL